LLIAGAAVLVALVMLIDLSFGWLLALVVVVALYELVVYQVARGVRGRVETQPVP
jgi:ribose/xylose/arabinose/galactoside ABC-type transport system permease subunit